MSAAPSLDQLFNLCSSLTIPEAAEKGDTFGWERQSEESFDEWRQHFLAYNGGPVEVIGWRAGTDGVSFWIARGPNAQTVCAYTTESQPQLFDALSQRLGTPETHDKAADIVTAFWHRDGLEIAFSSVGASAYVNISR